MFVFIISGRFVQPTYTTTTPPSNNNYIRVRTNVSSFFLRPSVCPFRIQARRKRQEEIDKLKQEEAIRKQQVSTEHTNTDMALTEQDLRAHNRMITNDMQFFIILGERKEKARSSHRQRTGNLIGLSTQRQPPNQTTNHACIHRLWLIDSELCEICTFVGHTKRVTYTLFIHRNTHTFTHSFCRFHHQR